MKHLDLLNNILSSNFITEEKKPGVILLQIVYDLIRLICVCIQTYIKYQHENNFIYPLMISEKIQFTEMFKKNYGKRNFSKYFTERKKPILNSQIQAVQNEQILDSISRTSSIRVNQKFLHNSRNKKKTKPFSFELIKNQTNQRQKENEFLQNLIKNQINSNKKQQNNSSSRSKRYKQKNQSQKQQKIDSVIKIYKSNNYIQFPAYSTQKSNGKISYHINSEASYRQAQKIRRQHSMYTNKISKIDLTAKTSQDSTFFKPQQNPKRIILFQKTFSLIQKGIFYSIQISSLKSRIIIFSDVVEVKKPKKFRLVMNPQDTKIFNSLWRKSLQQFVEKCLKVDTLNGITLNRPIFVRHSNASADTISKRSKLQMIYTSRKQQKQQNFIKIGSVGMTNQYCMRKYSSKSKLEVQHIIQNKATQISKEVEEYQQKTKTKNNLNINLSQIIQEQSKQILSKSIRPQDSLMQNNSKLQISQNINNNSNMIFSKIQNASNFQKDLTLNISEKFQQIKKNTQNKEENIDKKTINNQEGKGQNL